MIVLTEDVNSIFDKVLQDINKNIRRMMEELWVNWSHLGVDENMKISNITKLVHIEKELHRDVIAETEQKLKVLNEEVAKLRKESEELSKSLNVDISVPDYGDDMMLFEYKKALEDEIEGYRIQMQERRSTMERLMEWQQDLADKLGVTMRELSEQPLPSEEELEKLREHLELLQAERDKRVETFLNTQIEIKDIMEKLQIKAQNKFEHTVATALSVDFKVTDFNMERLSKLKQDLQEKYEHTNNRVLELRERLTKLWECLEEDQMYRDHFLQAHPGCHPETEAALKDEIKRCEQIKKQKIQVFVANMRTKIKLMWDNVMFSQAEREAFVHYFQDNFTEDTLTLHELHLDKITKFYNNNKQIFDLVLTRKDLWLKMIDLEARGSEPNRYRNRGGQLLKEEKERKATMNKLPRIEQQIHDLVTAYETETGKVFTVDGKPLLQLIDDEWENWRAERQNKASARKNALTPTTTPLFRSLAVSPLGKRDRTAAGLAATAERNRPPPKRQLITGSATKAVTPFTNNMSAFKRSAVTTIKRRISGRLAARVVAQGKPENAKRKLDLGGSAQKTTVNSSILKHKRTSNGKRRSGGRRSKSSAAHSTSSTNCEPNVQQDNLLESTLLTNYTAFKDRINENQISRSSMVNHKEEHVEPHKIPKVVIGTPQKPPKHQTLLTPKTGKENIQNHHYNTPKNNLLKTPTRLTRSAVKLNTDFVPPRAPLSAHKGNLQRENTGFNTMKAVSRSKSHTHLVRAKNVPPLI